MKVVLVTPWDNAWVPMFKESIEARGHQFELSNVPRRADVVIHGWATASSLPVRGARNVMFLRRFELFERGFYKIDWKNIDHLICVNDWIGSVVRQTFKANKIKTPVSVVYNAVDTRRWRYKERRGNSKVGMACHVHPKKNLPLALQVMALLPQNYELHIAGDIQDPCTAEYLNHVGQSMRRKVYLYGHIDRSDLDGWWEQMGVCLSTSLSEGNPNNVIEAMAKGIKPVIHSWPGSEEQFKGYLFDTVKQAAEMIEDERYYSEGYRRLATEKFSLANIERAVDLALTKEIQCAS